MNEWFSRLITHNPYFIMLTISAISLICLIVPFTTKKPPDFSDPQMGFEARGTIVAQRLTAWNNLIESTKTGGILINDPLEYYQYIQNEWSRKFNTMGNHNYKKRKYKHKGKKNKSKTKTFEKSLKLNERLSRNNITDHDTNESNDNFFCNWPMSSYARVVISVDSEEADLWSIEGVLAQYHIDSVLRANTHFLSLCQTELEYDSAEHKCCRSWSPANYVAFLSNRSSCLEITESDLYTVKTLLQRCANYYHSYSLSPNCKEDLNCQKNVPAECYTKDAVYHLLHYHLDIDFIPPANHDTNLTSSEQNSTLRSVMLFLPIAASSATLDFYKEIERNIADLTYGKFRVRGIQFGLKSTLFDRLLVSDSSLLLISFVFVMLCIWLYTSSIILTITTILAVVFSLGISYAIYNFVFCIQFFPFMNLLAIVVAIGIGADDAFIYCKIYETEKKKLQRITDDALICLVRKTMKHAFPSMFVTSLTTSMAFFASIVSNVTAINCFSLFAGITVIVNFCLMITWLPASVVVSERFSTITLSPVNFINRNIIHPVQFFGEKVAIKFTAILTKIVISLRYVWILFLGIVAIGCYFVVFNYPGLQLPDGIDLQLFDNNHPFEQYDLIYSRRFWFERQEMFGNEMETLMLRFVWGVVPIDTGDYLNPNKKGKLILDETFDVTSRQSQLWIEDFCENLRNAPFYRKTVGPLLPNCFIESLQSWMGRRCQDPFDSHVNYTPCCEASRFPYKPLVLQQCSAKMNAELYRTPYLWNGGGATSAGLKFLKEPLPFLISNNTNIMSELKPKIKALVIEYDSKYAYSLSFTDMNKFFEKVEYWMLNELRDAPPGMQHGWFISRLEFFELQRTLYEGTKWAIAISLFLALMVLVFVTLNLMISFFAIVTIGATIIVTVAILILLGWKLNVLESVAVSSAIGLAVDFSLHYAVSYKTCILEKNTDKTKAALQQMSGPTLMAAITSGAAGAFMLPSDVLAYIQIGIFLLLVMGISWIYATLFLCSILASLGPSPHCFQFKCRKCLEMFLNYFRRSSEGTNTSWQSNFQQVEYRGEVETSPMPPSSSSLLP